MAQHDDVVTPRNVLVLGERAPELRCDAKDPEIVGADTPPADELRHVVDHHREPTLENRAGDGLYGCGAARGLGAERDVVGG